MSFLGKLGSVGARFLGTASKGAKFLGANIGNIQRGARAVSSFANSAAVQKIGQQAGIKPSVFKQVGNISGQVANNLPGSLQAASDAVSGTKRNIGALYSAVNQK
eukprot:2788-Heterococcus_DN1.PRE.9